MEIHPYRYYEMDDDGQPIKEVDIVSVDGYMVGEKMLEGISFQLRWNPTLERYKLIPNQWQSDAYLQMLSKEYWVPLIEEEAEETDVLSLPGIEDDVVRGEMLDT